MRALFGKRHEVFRCKYDLVEWFDAYATEHQRGVVSRAENSPIGDQGLVEELFGFVLERDDHQPNEKLVPHEPKVQTVIKNARKNSRLVKPPFRRPR
jgi:hypothetical protein